MTFFALLALFGWIPLVVVLYALLPVRTAASVAVIGAWLFLPPYVIQISQFPDYGKNTAAAIAMILGTLLFAPQLIMRFRPRWFDLPMLAWCFCGVASSLQNGLGLYDGLSDALRQSLYWGLPYLLGRLTFNNAAGLRVFTVAMVVGGLTYVLPCLWEARMSPNLLGKIYGISGWQGIRLGGYRPNVFFSTGLECGLWMTAVSMTAWWLWSCGVLTKIAGTRFGMGGLPILLGTTVLCRSTGALILLASGVGLLWASTRFRTRALLLALVLFGPVYVSVRIPNLWSGDALVRFFKDYFSADRAESLEYRFTCENLLIVRAIEQPVLGWGGWKRSAVYFDEEGMKSVPTDGLWIITLGMKGYVGLILFYLALGLPAILFLWRFPATLWRIPNVAPAALAATLLSLYMVDCIFNGFINIIYVILAGAISGMTPAQLGVSLARGRGAQTIAAKANRALGRTANGTGLQRNRINGGLSQPTRPLRLEAVDTADRYRNLGRTLKVDGRFVEAQTAWRQALDILTKLSAHHPDSSELRQRWCDCANDLAWLLLSHPDPDPRDPALALTLASRVVEKCSDSSVYWNTLGVAYFRNGDFETAVTALNRAIALGAGGTAFDHIFLAMAHARLGNREESRQCLVQAMFQKERDQPGHAELTRYCDEAQSIMAIRTSAG